MKKIVCIGLMIFATAVGVNAQQIPSYGQYFINPYLYNPAMAGVDGETRLMTLFRNQWVGIPGAPETQALTIDGGVQGKKVGLGAIFYNDINNIITRQGGMATYAYHLPLAKDHTLSLGLSAGFSRSKIYFDRLQAEDPFDQALLTSFDNGTTIDGNFGISYGHKNLRVGVSALQLFQNRVNFSNDAGDHQMAYSLIRHYVVSAGYKFYTSSGDLSIEPIVLAKSAQGLSLRADFNLLATYKKNYWAGITYKLDAAMAFTLGAFVYDRITVGYSYEVGTSEFAQYNNGSHEVVLGFTFGKPGRTVAVSTANNSDLTRQNQELYELVDQVSEQNQHIREQIAKQEETIRTQNEEIQKLHEEIRRSKHEIDSVIAVSRVNIQEEDFESAKASYYTVVGAFKTLAYAKKFQQILRREKGLETSIVQKSNGNYFFIYTKSVMNRTEALEELTRIRNLQMQQLIVGNPWVYKQ